MTRLRRYELFLPLRFNDGQEVPEQLATEVFLELRRKFGAASADTQIIQGSWVHGESVYRDELTRLFIDVPDSAENAAYFSDLKERLKIRFKQIEIWITTYPIDAV